MVRDAIGHPFHLRHRLLFLRLSRFLELFLLCDLTGAHLVMGHLKDLDRRDLLVGHGHLIGGMVWRHAAGLGGPRASFGRLAVLGLSLCIYIHLHGHFISFLFKSFVYNVGVVDFFILLLLLLLVAIGEGLALARLSMVKATPNVRAHCTEALIVSPFICSCGRRLELLGRISFIELHVKVFGDFFSLNISDGEILWLIFSCLGLLHFWHLLLLFILLQWNKMVDRDEYKHDELAHDTAMLILHIERLLIQVRHQGFPQDLQSFIGFLRDATNVGAQNLFLDLLDLEADLLGVG